jgi:phage terminase small subunit
MDINKPLTKKQLNFCQAYVENGHNKVQAYLAAYDASYETARVKAYLMMKDQRILNRVAELEEEAWKQACITPAKMARELASQAFGEINQETGLTYSVKQKAMELLQKQLGLQVQKVEAEVKNTVIKVDIDDGE